MKKSPASTKGEAQERIVAAARELFARNGFDATSTKVVARMAGVPSGLIFYYFPTKDDLIEAVFDESPEQAVSEALDLASRANQGDRIDIVLTFLFDWLAEHRLLAHILLREISSGRPLARRLQTMRKRAITRLAEFFNSRTHSSSRADPTVLAQVVSSSLVFAVVLDYPKQKGQYIQKLAALVRRGMGA